MEGIIDNINNFFTVVFNFIINLLPDSPFLNVSFPDEMKEFLMILNYYVPFENMVTMGFSWTVCIGAYYAYQLILRYINAIK